MISPAKKDLAAMMRLVAEDACAVETIREKGRQAQIRKTAAACDTGMPNERPQTA